MKKVMLDRVKELFYKHRQIILYMLCSAITATIETVIGFFLAEIIRMDIVQANTISILIGGVINYLLISKKVFYSKYNVWTAFVYLVTFVIGLSLQNFLIWICYEYVFVFMWKFFRYVFSKGMSLVIPFGVMFYLRNWLFSLERKKR